MFSFRPFTEIDPREWDALVTSSPDGWVWALSGWQQLILAVDEWALEDCSFGMFRKGELIAVMPLQYRPASRSMASSGWGLTGPALSVGVADAERPRLLAAVIAHAEALARDRGASSVELGAAALAAASRCAPRGVNPFVALGYEDHSTHSRIIDLAQGAERIWSTTAKTARQQVRLARRLGIVAQRVDWLSMLDRYYDAHCATYRRTGVTPHPRRYFEGIAQHLAPHGHAQLWAAIGADGNPIAFRNEARLNGGVLYHTGCSNDEALKTGANYLLAWESICGAIADGFRWYDQGEVFPAATEGKTRSLTEFKSRFGGELHRYFKATKVLPQKADAAVPAGSAAAPVAETASTTEQAVREAYEKGELYAPSRICLRRDAGDDYIDRLLHEKLAVIAASYSRGVMVDLCCGTGAHLFDVGAAAERPIGIDFSWRYVEQARADAAARGAVRARFVQADARRLPLASASVALLYCLSALYAMPRAEEVVAEIGRVLAPGGRAVLDFGNRRSLNVFCLRYYTHWPSPHPLTLAQIRRALADAGLEVTVHRRFQLLPLWADRPRWLRPLLHPAWKRVMKRRVAGRMLDEWVSSAPLLRALAFRHLIVCEKAPSPATGRSTA